ncbi:hypothetical protein MMC14_002285 [Varicellaria rhodocarpa]|nr:hypothetical protein [Varicellaria rhodocarpa]
MDPLSLTASIIAIIGVGGEAAKAVRKLASLKGAPSLVLALNNEISDLYLVVLAIRDVHQRQRASSALSPNNASTDDTITSTLLRANEKVLELRALHQRLTSWTTGPSGLSTLNKASWLREQKNVKKMQEDLRTVRLKLSTTRGILNSLLGYISRAITPPQFIKLTRFVLNRSSLLHLESGVQALHTKLEDVRIHQQQGQIVQD